MKNIVLSLVVVAALGVASIGGTLADFSDSEEEVGDSLQAGSLDLKVNGLDDPNVLPFKIGPVTPDKLYDVTKLVSNVGTIDGFLYIHLKNPVTTETDDKPGIHPEPETVAELGGKVAQVIVPGVGQMQMQDHLEIVRILYDGVAIDMRGLDDNGDGKVKLIEVISDEILIGTLPACGATHELTFVFRLQDVPDPLWDTRAAGMDPDIIKKFRFWPTNAMQGDTLTFDVLVELLQTDYEPPTP